MWLLDTATLKLRHFITDIPDYVILSHTWGDGEVGFDDIAQPYAKEMAGYTKIWQCCARAVLAGFEWAWVDTCCIDKRSSAELSEAINSMYRWYWDAAVCYAYISDWSSTEENFQSSRWFKRGWTLQELLAPDVIEFFDSDWQFRGTKSSLLDTVHDATKIETQYLVDREAIKQATVAAKLSWAACRTTTREEDMAYCLLGLVQVNMPMLYGEGAGAFYRLQLEIIKQTNEHTIFAWETSDTWQHTSIFAPSPAPFMNTADLQRTVARVREELTTHEITNHGLRITFPCISVDHSRVIAVLDCTASVGKHVGLWLERLDSGVYRRLAAPRASVTEHDIKEATPTTMHIEAYNQSQSQQPKNLWTMKLRCTPKSFTIHEMSTGSRSATTSFYPLLDPKHKLALFKDLVLEDGEFVCVMFSLREHVEAPDQLAILFLGLHRGRLWIEMSSERAFEWVGAVEVKRKIFEASTQGQPGHHRHHRFSNYCEFYMEGGMLRISALRMRLYGKGKPLWSVSILFWSTCPHCPEYHPNSPQEH